MAGNGRSNNGVARPACVPAIHVFHADRAQDVDARDERGHHAERYVNALDQKQALIGAPTDTSDWRRTCP
jgi:hypothetical protein